MSLERELEVDLERVGVARNRIGDAAWRRESLRTGRSRILHRHKHLSELICVCGRERFLTLIEAQVLGVDCDPYKLVELPFDSYHVAIEVERVPVNLRIRFQPLKQPDKSERGTRDLKVAEDVEALLNSPAVAQQRGRHRGKVVV